MSSLLDRNFVSVIFVPVVSFEIVNFNREVPFTNGSHKNTNRNARHKLVPLISRLDAHQDELNFLVDWDAFGPQAAGDDLLEQMLGRIVHIEGIILAEPTILVRAGNLLIALRLVGSCEFELIWEASERKILNLERTLLKPQFGEKIQFNPEFFLLEIWVITVNFIDVSVID